MDIKIITTSTGDWEGLYVNGELIKEGHKINIQDVVKHIPDVNFTDIELDEEEFEAMKYSFPEKFDIDLLS